MHLVQDPGQRLVIYSADPGSPSEAGLRLLARLTAEHTPERALPQEPSRPDNDETCASRLPNLAP